MGITASLVVVGTPRSECEKVANRRLFAYPVVRNDAKKKNPAIASTIISSIKQGIAPCRGIAEGLTSADFFLIFGAAIQRGNFPDQPGINFTAYFLNKLSNAARASFALRGAGTAPFSWPLPTAPEGSASRATVTRGEKSSHVLA